MPVRRLEVGEAQALREDCGEVRPKTHTLQWLIEAMSKAKAKNTTREGGALLGSVEADEWTGYLALGQGLKFNIKAEYSHEHERMIEMEVLHEDWQEMLRQPRILFQMTGTKSYRAFVEYPEWVCERLKVERGEYISLYWMYGCSPRLVGKRDLAFRIKIGGKQKNAGRVSRA